jgi:3'-phosphoadenosine 5'-phosphosulfate (PAPS) 3'-phosphatase
VEAIRESLIEAVIAGASEVIRTKLAGAVQANYKDSTELVTAADHASDAAMRKVLESRLRAIDPAITLMLEESGGAPVPGPKEVGGDPIDGTNPFACGASTYSIQAHYLEHDVPQIGVIFQPEVFLPLAEELNCVGRLTWAVRGEGVFTRRSMWTGWGFDQSADQPFKRRSYPPTKRFVSCIPVSARMKPEEREQVRRILESDLVSVTTGVGGAGANVMLIVFGGQQVYANFGAGLDLDLIPPQVIAEETGLTVWGTDRKPPRWTTRKQPVLFAPNAGVAERFLAAAGF